MGEENNILPCYLMKTLVACQETLRNEEIRNFFPLLLPFSKPICVRKNQQEEKEPIAGINRGFAPGQTVVFREVYMYPPNETLGGSKASFYIKICLCVHLFTCLVMGFKIWLFTIEFMFSHISTTFWIKPHFLWLLKLMFILSIS